MLLYNKLNYIVNHQIVLELVNKLIQISMELIYHVLLFNLRVDWNRFWIKNQNI